MHPAPLFVSLTIAAAAVSAADLKDPEDVAQAWAKTIDQARESFLVPAGLVAQTRANAARPAPADRAEPPPADVRLAPGTLYDAPRHPAPQVLPDNLPPGAKPWRYGDQIYWIVPLQPPPGT